MAGLTFKKGSTPLALHVRFSGGGSLTYDEAYQIKIRHLTQRIADLKKKFEEAEIECPLMVISEANGRGGTHSRYFYKGFGCSFEKQPGAETY